MIVVSDTTPLRLEADEIRQKKFIVVKPVNNPESASIYIKSDNISWSGCRDTGYQKSGADRSV